MSNTAELAKMLHDLADYFAPIQAFPTPSPGANQLYLRSK